MRNIVAASIAAGTISILGAGSKAQYAPSVGPSDPTVYRYGAPGYFPRAIPYPMGAQLQNPRPNPTGYANRPYYGAYGYGNNSNGSTDGFPPFRGRRHR